MHLKFNYYEFLRDKNALRVKYSQIMMITMPCVLMTIFNCVCADVKDVNQTYCDVNVLQAVWS